MTEPLTDEELNALHDYLRSGMAIKLEGVRPSMSRLLATIASDRARITELEAELVTAESEAAHYSDLAMVDPGGNPRVAWKDEAARLTAENERLSAAIVAWVQGWDDAEPHVDNCVKVSTIHGVRYLGPMLTKEIETLREIVKSLAANAEGR